MNKKIIPTLLICMLIASIIANMAVQANNEKIVTHATSVSELYNIPNNPVGFEWPTNSTWGWGGDLLFIYAEVNDVAVDHKVYLHYEYCIPPECTYAGLGGICFGYFDEEMEHLGGNQYRFFMRSWENDESWGENCSFKYNITIRDNLDKPVFWWPLDDQADTIYRKPPIDSAVSLTLDTNNCYRGASVTVSGKAELVYTSGTIPAETTNVTINVGSSTYQTKTNETGNYSYTFSAPSTTGPYDVNVTVQNNTPVRNIPAYNETTLNVILPVLNITVNLNSTASLPSQQLWANGTIKLDGDPAGAGLQVNLTVKGTAISWTATTVADGSYTSSFTVPDTVGDYTVNTTVWHPAHNIRAYAEADFSVLATPLPDLAVTSANIVRTGTLVEGNNQRFNITVRNTGIAPANDTRINITMDGVLLNSTVRTIPNGANATISLNWTATPGIHNLTVRADPANAIEEASEKNNNASNVFTIAARTIGITLGLNAANVEPATPMWANGTVTVDGAAAPSGVQVNVSVGTAYWLVNTNAAGLYSAPFTASSAEGDYTANATVQYPGYEKYAWAEKDFTVAIPPTPDLSVTNENISVNGELVNGSAMYFRVEVRNIGTDAAKDVAVNISMDGTLIYASTQNIAAKAHRVLNASWTAVAGDHNITVEVDPAGTIAEFSETNNHAWKVFTVAPSAPEMVDIIIGPVRDADGNPIAGATVTVSLAVGTRAADGTYTGTTDLTGNAAVNVPATFLGQTLSINITKVGYEPVSFTAALSQDGTLAPQPPAMAQISTDDPADGGMGGYLWVIVIIAIAIIVLAAFRFRGGKPDAPAALPDAEPVPEEIPAEPAMQPSAPPEDPRIAKLQEAYASGRMSKEMYEKNLARFRASGPGGNQPKP